MSRRKPDFFEDLAGKIIATIGNPNDGPERRKVSTEFVKIALMLAHNEGIREGIDKAKEISPKAPAKS